MEKTYSGETLVDQSCSDTAAFRTLLNKIQTRRAVLSVIGLGYVGLPLAVAFAEAGYKVIGIDVDKRKVDAINNGDTYIADVSSEVLARLTPTNPLSVYSERSSPFDPDRFAQEKTLERNLRLLSIYRWRP